MKRAVAMLLLGVPLFGGCDRFKKPPLPPAEAEFPDVVAFTNRAEVVPAERIVAAEKAKTVSADFNLDGLNDFVVSEGTPDGQEEVHVYIQMPDPSAATTAGRPASKPVFNVNVSKFYMAGVIPPLKSGKVIGLMTRRGKRGQTDIMLVVARHDGSSEIVHYRNEGNRFVKAKEP